MQKTTLLSNLPRSLGQYPALFASLAPIPETAVAGIYRAQFVGPSWLQRIAPSGLKILGLGGWWGKWLQANGNGTNIVWRDNELKPYMPIRLETRASLLDGKPCLAVIYPPQSPFPWRHVIDELRILNSKAYLGMTITNLPLFNKLPFPFVLHGNPTEPEVISFKDKYTNQIIS